MASILKVDKLDPQSGTALEIGTSGDTITVPSGATLTTTNATLNLPTTITSPLILLWYLRENPFFTWAVPGVANANAAITVRALRLFIIIVSFFKMVKINL